MSRVPRKSPQGQRIRKAQGQVTRKYGKAGRHKDRKKEHNKLSCREAITVDVVPELSEDYPSEWDDDGRPMPNWYYNK